MDQIFTTLSNKIITREELSIVLEEIDRIQKSIFSKNSKPLSEQGKKVISKELMSCLQEWEGKNLIPKNPETRFGFLEQLKEYLQKIPQIKIRIACHPSDNFLKNIASQIEMETGKKIILDIDIDPQIVGGAITEYNGKYCNFSLEKEINKIIDEKKI